MMLDTRLATTLVPLALSLCANLGCWSNDPPDPLLTAPIKTIEILPSKVEVGQGKTFLMRARVRDENGYALPEERANQVQWTSSTPDLSISGSPNSTVTVSANGAAPMTVDLIATISGVAESRATITIVPARPPTVTGDWIISDYTSANPPSIALVNGLVSDETAVTPYNDQIVAFVGGGPLLAFSCGSTPNCGRVIAYPPSHRLESGELDWRTTCDIVEYVPFESVDGCGSLAPTSGSVGPLAGVVEVPVHVWKAAWGWNLRNDIDADIAYARRVFERPWSGVKLNVTYEGSVRRVHMVRQEPCDGGDYDVTAQVPGIPETEFQSKQITVIYSQDLSQADGSPDRGYTCLWNAREGTIVLLSAAGRENSDLAHELAHALARWGSSATIHSDYLTGFDPSNVLWSEETDYLRSIRSYVTLGQFYQITLSRGGFLQLSGILTRGTRDCQDAPDAAGECPLWSKDVNQ